ncbi:formate/nitrite transporter FocA (FNT family) [Palleronia aestuarii]|uniref:Formate/nitrite transporter FocA (FNT family) n=1 Tax=Palleronia aestuarii TaxID=568105 RepID=A0A2W7NDQ6_9RHOB|nr:formate/nitrite transporter family protein [Palleronia aestuarii]PZX18535.1 formate/nitrite transporter FocA (FNT family) [Palleronia aestuarii]
MSGPTKGEADARTEADEDEEMLQRDPDESLSNAPERGETVSDYFSFNEIFARILASADHELGVSNRYLFWSGLGAGAALGLTFLARVAFTEVSGEEEPGLLGNLLYPVGFLIIVLGRYQLFTENTLTPVTLLLTKLASFASVLRLWGVVLVSNMVGAVGIALLLSFFDVFTPERVALAIEIGRHAHEQTFFDLFSKALIAGWIVAAMVWLVHAGQDTISKVIFVYVLMYFIGVAGLYHIITSSVEVFYLAFSVSDVHLLPLLPTFVLPVLLGNTVGGVTFVAVLNYALFAEHRESKLFEPYGEPLSYRDWFFGSRRDSVN